MRAIRTSWCMRELTGISTKNREKKCTTFQIVSLCHNFPLHPNIQHDLDIFIIEKIFAKVEPW